MTDDTSNPWPYPGSRWWKFDFHTHTPASLDTPWARKNLNLSPEDWLLKYMAADIDCVAVTDHNSGAWIDRLKAAYKQMKQQSGNDSSSNGFRELTIFPGVEISVNAGFHLLAIFDPSATTRTITDLLATVRYAGTDGDSDDVTQESPVDVVEAVIHAGGIPIPAHSDKDKGLLRVNPGTRECALDPNSVKQVMEVEDLLAIEWTDNSLPAPSFVEKNVKKMAKVLGSDCHTFQGDFVPGSRYSWIKMAKPTLEGLRLALLDGNGVSVKRSDSDEEDFEPFQTPKHFIKRIKVNSARVMGNGNPEVLELSPWYNALVGGRGTGKSTIVHAIRLCYRRQSELNRLDGKSAPRHQFESFIEPMRGRARGGALREETNLAVEITMEDTIQALRWQQDRRDNVVWELDSSGKLTPSESQSITAERFPVRILSQGQIAGIAGDGRQALLDIIDDAASVGDLHRSLKESIQTYFTQRSRLREIDSRSEGKAEIERRLGELKRKLGALEKSQHTTIFRSHQRALRQEGEINGTNHRLQFAYEYIRSVAKDLLLDDWPDGVFDPEENKDLLLWKADADKLLAIARQAMERIAEDLENKANTHAKDQRLTQWKQQAENAKQEYSKLQDRLAKEGMNEPQAFGQMVQQRQLLEMELKNLNQLSEERTKLKSENDAQWAKVISCRNKITEARQKFVNDALHKNDYVRMEIVKFGYDANNIEIDLRDLLEDQEHFEPDILHKKDGVPQGGLAYEIAIAEDKDIALSSIKDRLTEMDNSLGGHFRNYLERKLNKPEFADYIQCWFPSDDIRIKYNRSNDDKDWIDIGQGSQGQRSAALLAFLLAFGNEPLILDQPEDDLDNHLIYELIVRQILENKLRRQLIIVTHNPNIVVNGDAEMVHAFDFVNGQCQVVQRGALQEKDIRDEVCKIMEGGREAFSRRWARLGKEV